MSLPRGQGLHSGEPLLGTVQLAATSQVSVPLLVNCGDTYSGPSTPASGLTSFKQFSNFCRSWGWGECVTQHAPEGLVVRKYAGDREV